MKITAITIRLEPTSTETVKGYTLSRDANKQWSVDGRGLFPMEVRLANMIQELVIEKFNGNQK